MLFTVIAAAIFVLFLPFILMAGRRSEEDRKMRARFALLQVGGAGGLSAGKQSDVLRQAIDHSPGRLDAGIERMSALLNLEVTLLQANSQQTSRALLRFSFLTGLAVTLCALFLTQNPLLLLPIAVGAAAIPLLLLRMRARRRTAAMNRVLPSVLDMISRALRAGHSMPAAIGIVAEGSAEPARSAFGEVFRKQKFGLPLRDALLELVRLFPSQDLKVLVTAILVQRETGGNLVQILERTSAVVRDRLKLEGDVRVHTAQGRLTGWILCMLPVLMMVMLLLTNPTYPKVLFEDSFGRELLYASVILLLFGGFLIHRIVKGIEV